jgi:biopolymer transport protein ExbD
MQSPSRAIRAERRRQLYDDQSGELNVVPYLDIVVNLIMFLLVAQAAHSALGIIDARAPSLGPGPAKASLNLTIGISDEGFFIAAKGGVLPGAEGGPTIPKRADRSFDYAALSAKLRAIKTAFPDTDSVYIAADGDVPYGVIVHTLDASREDRQGPLFPGVAFTQVGAEP